MVTGSLQNPQFLPPESSAAPRENAAPRPPAWKDEVAARVRAHRSRSRVSPDQPVLPGMEEAVSPGSVAARVAERYSRLPSWREAMAARAAAKSTVESLVAAASAPHAIEPRPQQLSIGQDAVPMAYPAADPPPEPYQPDLIRYAVSIDSLPAPRSTPPEARATPALDEAAALDPLENAVVEPTRPLPAALLTSPRELVAPRKARPRLAEGPLCDDPAPSDGPGTRSETEETSRFAHTPVNVTADKPELPRGWLEPPPTSSPDDHAIHLDVETPLPKSRSFSSRDEPLLQVASLNDRAMAALVDCAITLSAFLVFFAVFALSSTSLPHGRIALLGAGSTLFVMALLYQILFFTLTDSTPGMRYAKIALCTFDDENPTRPLLRGRVAALLLSALPLGLGFLWAVFDEDSLGWHDRITRTYQRSYREE